MQLSTDSSGGYLLPIFKEANFIILEQIHAAAARWNRIIFRRHDPHRHSASTKEREKRGQLQ